MLTLCTYKVTYLLAKTHVGRNAAQQVLKQKLKLLSTWFNDSFVFNLAASKAVCLQNVAMAHLYRGIARVLQHKCHRMHHFLGPNANGCLHINECLHISVPSIRRILHADLDSKLVLL